MLNASPALLCLLGSPRREGNTDLLAAEVCRGFESEGGVAEQIALSQLNLHPCTGCNACQEDRPEVCILDDDMQMLRPASAKGDILRQPGVLRQARELGVKLLHASMRADG